MPTCAYVICFAGKDDLLHVYVLFYDIGHQVIAIFYYVIVWKYMCYILCRINASGLCVNFFKYPDNISIVTNLKIYTYSIIILLFFSPK